MPGEPPELPLPPPDTEDPAAPLEVAFGSAFPPAPDAPLELGDVSDAPHDPSISAPTRIPTVRSAIRDFMQTTRYQAASRAAPVARVSWRSGGADSTYK
jgi:hypothetical protein